MTLPAVAALEEDWQRTLDAIARARGWPTSAEPAKLGALVRALSDAYNETAAPSSATSDRTGDRRVAASPHAIAARLGFSFARDVPKGAAAAAELVATGALAIPSDRPLRVLDVGAGLGATTWGVARALSSRGGGAIEATWVDEDAAALDVAQAIVRGRGGAAVSAAQAAQAVQGVTVSAQIEKRRAGADRPARVPYDLVLLGQVLSELDAGATEDERVAKHVALVTGLLASLDAHGSLIVIEPALRARTRHLHRVRDALVAARAATIFAPCLHASACPALAAEGDWCHEDRAVDLPPWLVPVARAAGLRWQGLTFAYLVLRKDDRTLRGALRSPPGAATVRVVSAPLVSKGKRELFLCGEIPSAHPERPELKEPATRVRAMRLDRDASPETAAWDELARGALVAIDPPPDADKAVPRIGKETRVTLLTPAEAVDEVASSAAPRG